MTDIAFEHWVYIDREFVEASYEIKSGKGPQTEETHTKEVGGSAGIGGISATAAGSLSKSFSVSKIKITDEIYERLMAYPSFNEISTEITTNTHVCTMEGIMYVTLHTHERRKGREIVNHVERTVLHLDSDGTDLELMPREEHFLGGMSALLESRPAEPEDLALPVKALLRVFPPKKSDSDWVAIPLVIHEKT